MPCVYTTSALTSYEVSAPEKKFEIYIYNLGRIQTFSKFKFQNGCENQKIEVHVEREPHH